ncbi:MAG: nitric oxide reductase FlRd-NAD(+) reductase [Methylococcaceae bacterium NSP1-2]|nr:FAD-dependent oxidoreductase [Methylococcaceae bacterium]OYV16244.1 MAG: nitric oxide reductase FlRd-NAD(+) reductase [Methylococcaceae bacterium NSP1-2]
MHVIIIGSGVAGVSFVEKYRTLAKDADITLITKENDGYYSRPLLSRGFTKDDIEHSIILKTFDKLRDSQINVLSDTEVTHISRTRKTLTVRHAEQEQILNYDKLIIATGSKAFIPPPYRPFNELFFCLNSLTDLKTLRRVRATLPKPHWAIIGGGLIGCEVASDLATAGDNVTLFHVMDRLMERQIVPEDSVLLKQVLENSGVTVLLNQAISSLSKPEEKICITTDTAHEFDAVIVACGFQPRTELATQAGLAIGRGIKVNDYLQTEDESIYALGDVAELPNGKLYAFILPIRSQALWLANHLAGQEPQSWSPPVFTTKAKVHGFEAAHPYQV